MYIRMYKSLYQSIYTNMSRIISVLFLFYVGKTKMNSDALFLPGRTGHTLTKLPGSNKALLFGGICMGKSKDHFASRFCKSCKDGRFYILNTDTYEWQYLKVPLITARTYHSTSVLESDSNLTVAVIGGVVFEETLPSHREALNEIVLLTMDKELSNCTLQEISLACTTPNTPDVFLSSHATIVHNNSIIVVGGIQTHTRQISDKAPTPLPTAYRISLSSKDYDAFQKTTSAAAIFGTYGHSLHKLKCENTLLVVGGSSRQISVLTDRSFEPEPCEFVPCTIASSPMFKDPTWIQCDKCKKWYHTHCIELATVPEGHYFCLGCKKQ
ncbi:uncharacterized protein LOC110976288 [Acanthaster planci]|uniref:Uncharacterized protein LOC110976288 n=1 Tax=Acanthaster planci TaxID=133434 RepID=A0A8B7XYJ8_ACAPL|nr:uncharacterized protein LOC110976288 [Acanthaster planci]